MNKTVTIPAYSSVWYSQWGGIFHHIDVYPLRSRSIQQLLNLGRLLIKKRFHLIQSPFKGQPRSLTKKVFFLASAVQIHGQSQGITDTRPTVVGFGTVIHYPPTPHRLLGMQIYIILFFVP